MGTTTDNTAASLNATDSAGSSKLYVRNDGLTGIGTTSPQATLDINGYARLKSNASPPVTCAAANDNALAMTSKHTLCVCNGTTTSWVSSNDGTTACVW